MENNSLEEEDVERRNGNKNGHLSIISEKKTVETSSIYNEERVHGKFITPRTD